MFKLGVILAGATLSASQTVTLTSYCTDLVNNCPGVHGFGTNVTTCETTMATFTTGSLTDVGINTLGCRNRFLSDPTLNATATKCRYAGPSGGGRCGSVLDAVCDAAVSACGADTNASYASAGACTTGLGPYVAQWGAKQGASAGTEDTLECRLYHAITGLATSFDAGGVDHCTHFNATGGPCAGAPTTDATHYCEVVTYHCNMMNDTNQWPQATSKDGMPECLASVGVFPNTPNDARASNNGNTLGCREYHAQAAASLNLTIHCQHAGPSGGGACGTYTEAWNTLASVPKCNGTIDVPRAVADIKSATNLMAMIPLGNDVSYNTNLPWDNTQRCRLYHLTTASVTQSHCTHGSVSGGGVCGSYIENLCTFIGGACGFGTGDYQFASAKACNDTLQKLAIATGAEADRAANTLQCRFYHAGIAASYASGGKNAGDANAAQNMKDHCNHVLVNSTKAGGCNVVMAPSPAPAKGAAAGVPLLVAVSVSVISMFAL